MNTNTLAKHYATLSATERLSLLLAAAGRGDEVEHGRLSDAAPRVTWRVPHTFGRALAFLGVFSQHRMERLDLAGLFFKTATLADATTGKVAARLRDVVGLYGYLVKINADGWARFCEQECLDSALCEGVAPGAITLDQAAREAQTVGFTEAEAQDYVRRGGQDAPTNLKTMESVSAGLGEMFQFLLRQWE